MSNEVEFEYTGLGEVVPKDVTIVRFHSSVTEVSREMFQECKQLKKVVLNEGLTKIGFRSFRECRKLEHINLPSTIIEIRNEAFHLCSDLGEVVFNEGLQRIGNLSFRGCESLKSIRLPSTITELSDLAFAYCISLRKVVLNEGLYKIGCEAFARCTSLEYIALPSTVTEIGRHAFYDCLRLREVELHERIQKIGRDSFYGCSFMQRFTFPKLSIRLDNIRAGQTEVEDKIGDIDEIRGILERRGKEMFISDVRLVQGQNWDILRSAFGRIDQLLTYYEVKEATTLLELAIWKSKIDQEEEENLINRDAHRIDIPGPVRDTILQYLNFRVIGDNFLVEQG